MNLIEPTYLRYVHDNLDKGSLNPENAAALPYGFIGLYEEAFQSNIPISKRQSTLKRLAIWALFKGGVSAYLASQILNENQEESKSLIDSFSSWFNTTDSNKYILYHDRLRTYLLQKLSSHELQNLNEQIISCLEKALEAQNGDEAEIYALEHLSTHMAIESQTDSNYQRLHDFANQDSLWPRQVSVSKEFKWSQQALQHSIKEGARRHHEMNTLSSTVNSVKLIQDEENSVNQILNLLNQGDYTTALERALFFNGGKLITTYLLMINELLINENQSDNYKSKVYKEIIEIIKKNDVKQKDFPVILIYKFYLEFKRLSLDYSVLLANYSFDYYDILYLLEFDIDVQEIEYLVKKFIHISGHPDIYIAISKFYLDKNDKTKTIHYLEKSLDKINSIPVSYGQYYNFELIENEDLNEQEYYRTIIRWKLLIGFIYYDIEKYSSSKEILNEILLIVDKFSDEIEEKLIDDLTINISTWFDIFKLCFLLDKYDNVINSKWFERFLFSQSLNYLDFNISSLLRVLFIQKNNIQFEKFNKFLKDNEYDRRIICEIDYYLLLCSLGKLDEAERLEDQIVEEINSLQFGELKFNALIYFVEILFEAEKYLDGTHELAENIIEFFFSQLKRLNNQNSDFYYGLINDLIKTCFRQNKIEKALEIYSTYFSEINEKNNNDPKQKYNFLNKIFKSLLSYDYKNPNFLIDKLKEIGPSVNYYDMYEMVYLDLISREFVDEAIIFANEHNIKNKTFPKMDSYFNQYGVVLKTKFSSDIKNISSINYELLSTSDSRIYSWENEMVISFKYLKKLKIKNLKDLLNLSADYSFSRHYREITLLDLMGAKTDVQNYLIEQQKVKIPKFEYCSYNETSDYYRSRNDKLITLQYLNPSHIDINYLILNELSLKMKWDILEQVIDRFNFDYDVKKLPFPFLGELSCSRELVLEKSFFNIKLKILLKMLITNNDASLTKKLFEICSDLSKKSFSNEKVIFSSKKYNFSAVGYLQLSNVLNQIGLTKYAIKAINEAFLKSNEDSKSDFPTNSQIIKVFIHICMSSLEKDVIFDQFEKIISKYNFYVDDWKKGEGNEELLYLFLEPLVQLGEISKAVQIVNMILKIIENIPVEHPKMLYIKDGMELSNTELARKHKSISNISYFYYAIGDFKKGNEYYNLLSDELVYDSDKFYGDTHYQVGFDRNEVKNKYINQIFPKYEKVVFENIDIKENEIEFNGAVYKDSKDREIMESNFDYSFSKNNIEFQFLSKNQNPHESFSYLFYKAKMACFFEDDKKEEKLDLLEQVIDIKEWKEISKSL